MKAAFAKTLSRMTGRAMMDPENSDNATITTPKSASRTPRSSMQLRPAFTCLKPRPLLLTESSTSIKRRPSPISGDSVKVFVRVKPVMEDDLKQGRAKEAVDICEKDGKRGIVLPAANSKENWFSDFDGVLDDATNQEVFDAIGGNLLRQYLNGINVSIMAYGQTGSGKTYTMGFGCSNEPGAQAQGLLHLVLNGIDKQIVLGTHMTRLSVSVFEVYNDELFSLLDAAGVEKRPLVKGMTDYQKHVPKQVNEVNEAISLVLEALQHRARDATFRNATSSRSHAFVKLRLEQLRAGSEDQGVDSTLFLVDLAGSESMSNASSSTQQSETIHINKSLQALERVVNNLSNCSAHVPYRDSLLTQVLEKGLNPKQARVALVTTVSRFHADVHVTKSTLMFAQRARNIRTFAQVNHAAKRPQQSCPEEMHRQLQNMQAINHTLRQRLADLESSHERQLGRSQHMEAIRDELARLGELHSELQRTSARQQAEAEAALEAERAAHAVTRSTLAQAQRANGELRGAVEASEEAEQAAARGAAELRSRLAEAQLQVVRLNGELAGSQSLAAQVQAQLKAAQEQLVQAMEQLTTLKGQLAAAKAGGAEDARQLQQHLAELAAEAAAARDSATSEATTFQTRVRELQQQLVEANQDAAGLAAELADAKQQVEELQRRITDDSADVAGPQDGWDGSVRAGLQQEELVEYNGDEDERAAADAALCLQQLREQPTPTSLVQGFEEGEDVEAGAAALADEDGDGILQTESSDGAMALVNELERTQAQLEECTAQLAEAEGQLAETREQLAEATAAAADAEERLAETRAVAEVEVEAMRQQLAEAAAARSAAAAAAATAAQEARAAAETAAAERLVPLQTECERLRAMCALSEQQLERLQAECERLRADGGEAQQEAMRLAAERDRAREAAARAEAEATERLARLEAAAREERGDVGPRQEALKQLQERVRLLEVDKKRSETDHKGQLELKDKLIRQLENMNFQLQSEVTKLRQDTSGSAAMLDQLGGSGDSGGGAADYGSSPFAASQLGGGSRSEAGASPGPTGPVDDSGVAGMTPSVSAAFAPPSRAPSSGGILLLNRTTTGSAAALARNNSRAAARPDFSTPPPAPRYAPGTGPSPSQGQGQAPSAALLTPPNSRVAKAAPDGAAPLPAAAAAGGQRPAEMIDLLTPDGSVVSTPGPTPPRLMPVGYPAMEDGLVVVLRGAQRPSPDLKLTTNAVRNQMNY